MSCDHWERRPVYVEEEHPYTGEVEGRWIEEQICLSVDISIGACKCTRCGKIEYYTGAWREYYEKNPSALSESREAE